MNLSYNSFICSDQIIVLCTTTFTPKKLLTISITYIIVSDIKQNIVFELI